MSEGQHIRYLRRVIAESGIPYYEKAVEGQMLEFLNYYVQEVGFEAQRNRLFRLKFGGEEQSSQVTHKDIELAIEFKQRNKFVNPSLSKGVIEKAKRINSVSLESLVLDLDNDRAYDKLRAEDLRDPNELDEYRDRKIKQTNFSDIPTHGSGPVFRLDQPNLQVSSEDIKQSLLEKFKFHNSLAKEDSLLGKRDQPEFDDKADPFVPPAKHQAANPFKMPSTSDLASHMAKESAEVEVEMKTMEDVPVANEEGAVTTQFQASPSFHPTNPAAAPEVPAPVQEQKEEEPAVVQEAEKASESDSESDDFF